METKRTRPKPVRQHWRMIDRDGDESWTWVKSSPSKVLELYELMTAQGFKVEPITPEEAKSLRKRIRRKERAEAIAPTGGPDAK